MVDTSQVGRKIARKRAHKALEIRRVERLQAEESLLKSDRPKTGAELVRQLTESGAFGAWAHREDIQDSVTYAAELRKQAQKREGS